jgi:hypothetical protein
MHEYLSNCHWEPGLLAMIPLAMGIDFVRGRDDGWVEGSPATGGDA